MKARILKSAAAIAVSLTMSAPAALVHSGEGRKISAAGCKTEYFLMKDIFSAYKKTNDVTVRLGKTGNKKAIDMMLNGEVDFAFTCKPIEKLTKKLKLDADRVSSWKSIPIAKDPIVVVVNPGSGVKDLSLSQLTDVFGGKVKNWQEVGGKNQPVAVAYLDPEIESGVLLLFKEFTVGSKGELDAGAARLDGPQSLGQFTNSTPGGVTFMAYTSYKKAFGDILAIDGVMPSKDSILDGTYGLSATYYLTVDEKRMGNISPFIEYSTGEGQKVISENFIPVSE